MSNLKWSVPMLLDLTLGLFHLLQLWYLCYVCCVRAVDVLNWFRSMKQLCPTRMRTRGGVFAAGAASTSASARLLSGASFVNITTSILDSFATTVLLPEMQVPQWMWPHFAHSVMPNVRPPLTGRRVSLQVVPET